VEKQSAFSTQLVCSMDSRRHAT